MTQIIEQTKLRLKAKLTKKSTLSIKLLADKVFSADKPEKSLLIKITNLELFERWLLLSEVLKLKKLKSFHFLHIPKTGGTTFGETLGKDKKAVIVSVDAAPKTLLLQFLRLVNAQKHEIVLSRAHHSLKLIKESDCINHFSLIITAYRNPIEIHVSNVNMIMRRLNNFFDKNEMPEAEKMFCKEWAGIIGYNFSYTKEFANKIINSKDYQEKMGNLYSRFFNIKHWKQLIEQKKLAVVSSNSFDQIFTDVFDYKEPPTRKNVSTNPLLTQEQLSEQNKKLLIDKDKDIISILSNNLIKPADLKSLMYQ